MGWLAGAVPLAIRRLLLSLDGALGGEGVGTRLSEWVVRWEVEGGSRHGELALCCCGAVSQ